MKKYSMAALALCALAVSCLISSPQAEAKAKKALSFSKSTDILEDGAAYVFKTKTKGKGKIVWKSSDTGVLSVTKKGKVKAKSVGVATITASLGTVTAAKEVRVYPSLQEIKEANEIYKNLRKGTYSSVAITDQTGNFVSEKMASVDPGGEIVTAVSSSGIQQVWKGNLRYFYNEKGFISIYADTPVTSGSVSYPYDVFSNETVTDVSAEENTYKISTETDIAKATEQEQRESIGISRGTILKTIVVDKETGLLLEYEHSIVLDEEIPDFKITSKEVFSYNENGKELVPEAVKTVIGAEKTRTVTVISKPGTTEETKQTYTLPETMPLYIAGDITYYKDAECTEEFSHPSTDDKVYDSYTLYTK